MVMIAGMKNGQLMNVSINTPRPTVMSARWAGHAVFTSGLTVILSEVVLWLANIPFFSDSGFANAIGVTITLLVANTLLLSILPRYGTKIFKKTANGDFHEGSHKHLHAIGLFSTKHIKAMVAIFVVVSILGLTVYEVTPIALAKPESLKKGIFASQRTTSERITVRPEVKTA